MAAIKYSDGLIEEAPGVIKRPRPSHVPRLAHKSGGCTRCHVELAQVNCGNDRKCGACLHDHMLDRLRHAVKTKAAVCPGDRLLVAFSGGAGSRALIQLLESCRTTDWSRLERGKVRGESQC